MKQEMLTLGVPKGRLMKSAVSWFGQRGIDISIAPEDSRSVLVPTSLPDLRLCPVRSKDVGMLLETGVLDLALVGSDTLEEAASLCVGQRRRLDICKCRMSVLGLPGTTLEGVARSRPKVVTKYPATARKYFAGLGADPEITTIGGSAEVALLTGLAPFVVDIVSTGATIARNELIEVAVIKQVCAEALISHRTLGARRARCNRILDGTAVSGPTRIFPDFQAVQAAL